MTADIVDLAAVSSACQPLMRWWQHFLATGDGDLRELERARSGLQPFAELPGGVGAAMRHLSGLGITTSPAQLTHDLELVQRIVALAPSGPTTRRRRPRKALLPPPHGDQLMLPGLDA